MDNNTNGILMIKMNTLRKCMLIQVLLKEVQFTSHLSYQLSWQRHQQFTFDTNTRVQAHTHTATCLAYQPSHTDLGRM